MGFGHMVHGRKGLNTRNTLYRRYVYIVADGLAEKDGK